MNMLEFIAAWLMLSIPSSIVIGVFIALRSNENDASND
jgi:hypothetical protein